MAAANDTPPFIKQLAAGDRPTREKALDLLTTYLTSGRPFTHTELLKIWKGLFYTMHHTDRPLPQQRLARTLTDDLLVRLSSHQTQNEYQQRQQKGVAAGDGGGGVFLPFLAAFWATMIRYYSDIPSLRLDKYLFLVRCYVRGMLGWVLAQQNATAASARSNGDTPTLVVEDWKDLMRGRCRWAGMGVGVLDTQDVKVPDGLRYHVLDVWVDGLMEREGWKDGREVVMGVVQEVARDGRTKVLRERAKDALNDERLITGEDRSDGDGQVQAVVDGGDMRLDGDEDGKKAQEVDEFGGFED